MELFFDNLKRQEAVTLSSVRKAALASLPVDCGNAPWRYTERGKVVYETEEQLDCYLASYTRWHEGKLRKAFDMIPLEHLRERFPSSIGLRARLGYDLPS